MNTYGANRRWRNAVAALAAGVGLIAATPGSAAERYQATPAEIQQLSPMCVANLSKLAGLSNSPDISRWSALPDWTRLHHYCMGHVFFNRARAARSPRDRARYIKGAEADFSYMIEHDVPGAVFTAESYMWRGIARIMLKEESDAASDFVKAISRDPRLVGAYLALADLYADRKQRAEALEVVTNGLRYVPSSEGLKRKYRDLGGQGPFPEPVARKEAEAPSKPAASQPEANAAAASLTPADAKPATEPQAVEATASPSAAAPARARSCRFCAEDLPPAETGSAPPKADEPTPPAKPRSCRFCAD